MRRLGNRPDAVIEALHSAQDAFGYLDDEALSYVSQSLRVPPSKVFGVATFYRHFTMKPRGEHTSVVCTGTACFINGASEILQVWLDDCSGCHMSFIDMEERLARDSGARSRRLQPAR